MERKRFSGARWLCCEGWQTFGLEPVGYHCAKYKKSLVSKWLMSLLPCFCQGFCRAMLINVSCPFPKAIPFLFHLTRLSLTPFISLLVSDL